VRLAAPLDVAGRLRGRSLGEDLGVTAARWTDLGSSDHALVEVSRIAAPVELPRPW